MFSTFIRLGAALTCAAMLSSCGGDSVAETQQSTPEGIYTGGLGATITNSAGTILVSPDPTKAPVSCTNNVIEFAVATGSIYIFYPSTTNPAVLNAASYGVLTFGGDAMSSSMLQVSAPASATPAAFPAIAGNFSSMCDTFSGNVAPVSMVGGYETGVNLTQTLTYNTIDTNQNNIVTTTLNPVLTYDADYQGVQNLSTLAGTFNGYVSTSQFSEPATFTIGPPSVPANAGNSLGVSVLTGTGASGCSYSGSVSPLYKGNGYTISISSGGQPCKLPQSQFVGLIYLNTSKNILYSFAPNTGNTDGVIFSGTRS